MTETQVNIPLLRKAVEWAEAEAAKPEWAREWDQGAWWVDARFDTARDCKTAFCIAGWTCFADGADRDPRFTSILADGTQVSTYAAHALGLTEVQAAALFDGGNQIADVRRIAEDIAGERL